MKSSLLYLNKIAVVGGKGIWDNGVLPKYFHDNRSLMQAETNPLHAFMHSDRCNVGPEETIVFSRFKEGFKEWVDANNLSSRQRLTDDFCSPVFRTYGITVITPPSQAQLGDDDDGFNFGGGEHEYAHATKYLKGVSFA